MNIVHREKRYVLVKEKTSKREVWAACTGKDRDTLAASPWGSKGTARDCKEHDVERLQNCATSTYQNAKTHEEANL